MRTNVRTDVNASQAAPAASTSKDQKSAVRPTHIPTNIVVKCQQDRSQHRNRAMAWDMLRAKLFEAGDKEARRKPTGSAAKTDIGWGHRIRSYVLAAPIRW